MFKKNLKFFINIEFKTTQFINKYFLICLFIIHKKNQLYI